MHLQSGSTLVLFGLQVVNLFLARYITVLIVYAGVDTRNCFAVKRR